MQSCRLCSDEPSNIFKYFPKCTFDWEIWHRKGQAVLATTDIGCTWISRRMTCSFSSLFIHQVADFFSAFTFSVIVHVELKHHTTSIKYWILDGFTTFLGFKWSLIHSKCYLGNKYIYNEPFQCFGYFHLKHKDAKIFWKPSKPRHVGIYWIALAEYSQMSTMCQSFSRFIGHFCIILYCPNQPLAA